MATFRTSRLMSSLVRLSARVVGPRGGRRPWRDTQPSEPFAERATQPDHDCPVPLPELSPVARINVNSYYFSSTLDSIPLSKSIAKSRRCKEDCKEAAFTRLRASAECFCISFIRCVLGGSSEVRLKFLAGLVLRRPAALFSSNTALM